MKQLVSALEVFKVLNINFISLTEHIDTILPAGESIFGVFASLAQFERRMIQERVKNGLRNAIRNGKRLGQKVEIDIPMLLRFRSDGFNVRKIAQRLGCSHATVSRILS